MRRFTYEELNEMPSHKNVGGSELKIEERDASIGHHVRVWFNDNSDKNHPAPFVLVETWDTNANDGNGAWVPERYEVQSADDEEDTAVRTRYQVSWHWTERPDKARTSRPMVDSAQMTRPDDPEQRDQLIRLQLKNLLPIGQGPEAVILDSVQPICNCEPFPEPANCLYREHKGQRFYLTTSTAYAGCEVIHDRHDDKIMGIVSVSVSVAFLTMVREKYGHQ